MQSISVSGNLCDQSHSMRSSNECRVLPSFHDDNYRQRRRRKEQPQSKCSPHQHQRIIVFLSSVWICLHYNIHHVESGYISSRYRSVCPSNCRSHEHGCILDQSRYNIAVQRFLLPNQQKHHFAMRSFDVSLPLVPNDRNSDQDDSNSNNKNNSADQIIRNMGGFVPFFATQSPQPSPEPVPPDTSKSAFWGVSEWFRRDTQNKTNDTTSSKKIEAKSIKKNSKVKTTTTTNSKTVLETPSPLSRIQELISFNSTKSPDKKDNTKSTRSSSGDKSNRDNSTSTGNNNPLSVFQKFFATTLFQSTTISEEETWYPVFPKTRIMPGEMVPVSVMGIDLLVIASIDGRSLYCIANSCPHLGTPLETGRLTRLPIESKSLSSSLNVVPSQSSSSSSSLLSTDSILTSATSTTPNDSNNGIIFTETDIANILSQDGCEDCIICPLHRTAFALTSGEVRGEWCPYPPVIGALMGTVKEPTSAAVFQVRTRGKNIEVRLNSVLPPVRESS